MPSGPLLGADDVSNPPVFDIPPVNFRGPEDGFNTGENYKKIYNLVKMNK